MTFDKLLSEATINDITKIVEMGNKNGFTRDRFKRLLKIAASYRKGMHAFWAIRAATFWPNVNYNLMKQEIQKAKIPPYKREMFLKYIPKGVSEVKDETEKLRKTSKKLPIKPLKLKEGTRKLEDMTISGIYRAGMYWKNFDFDKGLDLLIKKDKTGNWICYAGTDWKKFDYEKGLKTLKALKDTGYYKNALEDWPKGVKGSKKEIERLRKTSKKLPIKPLKLKEENKNVTGIDIIRAGKYQKNFNFDKGLDELIKVDEDGYWIYNAGKDWKQFDFKKGFNELIKKDKEDGYSIYNAGLDWKKFDNEKGLEALKVLENKYYYKKALKVWPKSVEDSKKEIERLRKTSKKLPIKRYKL